MWLSFEEYSEFGGTASENDFAGLELKARKRIDYRTFERISTPSDDVKRLVFEQYSFSGLAAFYKKEGFE